jgi:hypothetical protein
MKINKGYFLLENELGLNITIANVVLTNINRNTIAIDAKATWSNSFKVKNGL